jgi:hypothetical protein
MVDTIIKNFDSLRLGDASKIASLTLKVNSSLKSMGFKKAVIAQEYIRENTLEDDLTIHFRPYFDDMDYCNRTVTRDSFWPLMEYLRGLKGCYWYEEYYSLKNSSNQIMIKTEYNGTKYEIGHYLKDKNIVIIYFPLNIDWELGLKNEYILEVLKLVKEGLKNITLEKVDISKVKEKIIIGKFLKNIDSKIEKETRDIKENERYLKDYTERFVICEKTLGMSVRSKRSLIETRDKFSSGMTEEFDNIRKLKFVKSVGFGEDGVEIKFNEVYIKFNGEDVRMGNYTIILKGEDIGIVNSDAIEMGGTKYHSLHIESDAVCFGDQRSMVFKMLANLELKKLSHFLWLYLNSFNPADTYIPMRDWVAARANNGVVPDDHEDEDYCDECGEYVNSDDYSDDYDMCYDCLGNVRSYCDSCNEYVLNEDYNMNYGCCQDCYEDNHKHCSECGEWVDNDDYSNDKGMCNKCAEKKEEEQNDGS